MKRRRFSALLSGAAAWPALVRAQQKPMPVIGWLNAGAPCPVAPSLAAFRQGLGESGYVEGRNVTIEYRWAENDSDRLPALAADLVGRKVDVLVTGTTAATARVALKVTSTIPIVFATSDPVEVGLVTSMARPTGNLTGVGYLVDSLNLKRFDLLVQAVPQARVIGLLVNPSNPHTPRLVPEMQEAARAHGLQLVVARAANDSEIDEAFASFVQGKAGALVIQADPVINSRRARLLALSARHALPAKPADLPIVQPTTFELIVNMKTAKTLGLTLPPSILALADEIIE